MVAELFIKHLSFTGRYTILELGKYNENHFKTYF
jgi:hypothetical protein